MTVVAPTLKTVNVSLKVTDGAGSAEAIKAALTKYFKASVFGTNYTTQKATHTVTISYAQIGRIILDNSDTTGVNDYDDRRLMAVRIISSVLWIIFLLLGR